MAEQHGASVAFEGVCFHYPGGGFELSIRALALEPGEQVACIGPSGCGKTTLLALAAGILLPAAGSVSLDGRSWSALGEADRRRLRISRVGLVFQELELLQHLSVRENMLLPYYVNRALSLDDDVEARLADLAGRTGIDGLLDRHPRELSQGERQRAAVCRALLPRPGLLLADEPTGNLDPETSLRVIETLRSEASASGATLLVVTHDRGLDEFERVIDLARLACAATEGGA